MANRRSGTLKYPYSLVGHVVSAKLDQVVDSKNEDTECPTLINNKEDFTIPECNPTRPDYCCDLCKEIEERKLSSVDRLKISLEEEGYKVHAFREHSLHQVLDAIHDKRVIDDIDIVSRLQAEDFRFISYDLPEMSLLVSQTMVSLAETSRKIAIKSVSTTGYKKLKKNADDFARSMFDIVEKIKQETEITSLRGIAAELNEREIKTFQKHPENKTTGWHASTLINLNKRWQEMGLIPPVPNPK